MAMKGSSQRAATERVTATRPQTTSTFTTSTASITTPISHQNMNHSVITEKMNSNNKCSSGRAGEGGGGGGGGMVGEDSPRWRLNRDNKRSSNHRHPPSSTGGNLGCGSKGKSTGGRRRHHRDKRRSPGGGGYSRSNEGTTSGDDEKDQQHQHQHSSSTTTSTPSATVAIPPTQKQSGEQSIPNMNNSSEYDPTSSGGTASFASPYAQRIAHEHTQQAGGGGASNGHSLLSKRLSPANALLCNGRPIFRGSKSQSDLDADCEDNTADYDSASMISASECAGVGIGGGIGPAHSTFFVPGPLPPHSTSCQDRDRDFQAHVSEIRRAGMEELRGAAGATDEDLSVSSSEESQSLSKMLDKERREKSNLMNQVERQEDRINQLQEMLSKLSKNLEESDLENKQLRTALLKQKQ